MKHKYPASFPLLCIVFLHITFLACERRELTYYEVAEISLSADWSLSGLDSKEADFGVFTGISSYLLLSPVPSAIVN